MKKNKISIIIITLNEEKNILNILDDLKNQTHNNFEIIISDSNSSDNTEIIANKMKNEFSEFRFENCGKTLGPSYGRNYGVKFAKYDRLLFLDADTRLKDKKFLQKFQEKLNRNKIDSGGVYIDISNNNLLEKFGVGFINFGYRITQYFSPTSCGACMFSTKTVHSKINGFRENVLLCEDCDYVRDAKKNKFNVGMLDLKFNFSDRRLKKDGYISTGFIYVKATFIRIITGKSILKDKIKYKFDNY